MTDTNAPPVAEDPKQVKEEKPATETSEATQKEQPTEFEAIDVSTLVLDDTLTDCEQFYDILRRVAYNDSVNVFLNNQKEKNFNVNEILKNGDTLLCMACTKNYGVIVRTLVNDFGADVNLARSVTSTSTSFSTITPTISISARRQSRLIGTNNSLANKPVRGDTPLSICIKYGHEDVAEFLIDQAADISGTDPSNEEECYADFERSPLQDAVRLSRTKIVEKMLQSMFVRDDIKTIEWVFAKRNDILRQVIYFFNLKANKTLFFLLFMTD